MAGLRSIVIGLLVAAPGLVGCVASEVDPAAAPPLPESSLLLDVDTISEHLPVISFDGTVIDQWVYRPDMEEPVPVIINFSPYWHNLSPPAADGGDAFSRYLIGHFVPRGYAVALVSARGTGLSEGCFSIGGPDEVQDMGVVVDTLVAQPWANGNVTATGKSYDGAMAVALLTLGHPSVKTIVPVSPATEWYKYNGMNGVPYQNGFLPFTNSFNTDYVLAVSLSQTSSTFDPSPPDPTDDTYEKLPTRFCAESLRVQASQYRGALLGDYDEYWQARNYTALLPADITASVFHIHGLQDWNVKPDHMDPWIQELRERDVTVKLMLGQWGHDYPHRDDWNATLLAWLDHHLKGMDTGILDEPLVQVQDTAEVWRDEDEWPPARATWPRYYPSADGTLGLEPGTGETAFLDATMDPIGGARFELLAPESGGYRISGSPVVHTVVSATQPRAAIGVLLRIDDTVVDEGWLDLAHRDGLAMASPMTPGAQYAVTFAMHPQDLVVPPGSTLSIEFTATDSPLLDAVPLHTGARVTVHFGEGTFIDIPYLAMDDARIEEPQPQDVGCWSC